VYAAGIAYQSLLRWPSLFRPGASLSDFLHNAKDATLANQIGDLGALLYSPANTRNWSGQQLAVSLKKNRKFTRLKANPHQHLPTLNPRENLL
jgi:hypothetical protein